MSLFKCKEFTIRQSDDVYKITSDTTLIGAWADVHTHGRVLEVGCGSGMISLMLAQRYPNIQIDALDINAAAVELSNDNFSNCTWSNRLTAFHAAFSEYSESTQHLYDDIISNPPYHNSSTLPPGALKATAKHDNSLPFKNLIENAVSLLKPKGRIHLIITSDRINELLEIAKAYSLHPAVWCDMYPRESKPAKRTLLTLTKEGFLAKPSSKIIMYDGDNHHVDFKHLLKSFLIIF